MSRAPHFDANRDAPPRLVLRFAIATCVGLALAACAILLVVRHFSTVQAERGAAEQARVIANSVLRGNLLASDFARPVAERRLPALDDLFESHVLEEGVLLVNLYAEDGMVTSSTDHRLIGTRTSDLAHLREAHALTIRGDVTTTRDPATSSERRHSACTPPWPCRAARASSSSSRTTRRSPRPRRRRSCPWPESSSSCSFSSCSRSRRSSVA